MHETCYLGGGGFKPEKKRYRLTYSGQLQVARVKKRNLEEQGKAARSKSSSGELKEKLMELFRNGAGKVDVAQMLTMSSSEGLNPECLVIVSNHTVAGSLLVQSARYKRKQRQLIGGIRYGSECQRLKQHEPELKATSVGKPAAVCFIITSTVQR